jgi:hypothetical protein
LAERPPEKRKVTGSTPVSTTTACSRGTKFGHGIQTQEIRRRHDSRAITRRSAQARSPSPGESSHHPTHSHAQPWRIVSPPHPLPRPALANRLTTPPTPTPSPGESSHSKPDLWTSVGSTWSTPPAPHARRFVRCAHFPPQPCETIRHGPGERGPGVRDDSQGDDGRAERAKGSSQVVAGGRRGSRVDSPGVGRAAGRAAVGWGGVGWVGSTVGVTPLRAPCSAWRTQGTLRCRGGHIARTCTRSATWSANGGARCAVVLPTASSGRVAPRSIAPMPADSAPTAGAASSAGSHRRRTRHQHEAARSIARMHSDRLPISLPAATTYAAARSRCAVRSHAVPARRRRPTPAS